MFSIFCRIDLKPCPTSVDVLIPLYIGLANYFSFILPNKKKYCGIHVFLILVHS